MMDTTRGIRREHRSTGLVGLTVALAIVVAVAAPAGAGQTLQNHQTLIIKGAQGDKGIYHIHVPANTKELVVTLNGGLGDADLHLKHESQPGTTAKSNSNPKSEKVVLPVPLKGRWDIMVHGRTFYMGVQLRASHSVWGGGGGGKPPSPPTMAHLGNGHWVHNQNGQASNRRYEIAVPPSVKELTFQTVGGTGSCALLVRRGAPATPKHHDHGSAWKGTNQKVTIQNPAPGMYFALLQGRPAFQGVSVMARYVLKGSAGPGKPPTPGSPPSMANLGPGHWVHNQNGKAQNRHYRIEVPPNAKKLIVRCQGGSGKCALLVRRGGPASPQHHERAAWGPGTHKVVTWINPPPGPYYALVHGQPQFHNVSVMANFELHGPGNPGGPGSPLTIADLGPGHWVHHQNGKAANRHYRIVIPPNIKTLTFRCQGGTGSCALLVRRGGLASLKDHDQAGHAPGTTQQVTLHNPPPGAYYAVLHGRPQFHGVSVMAAFVPH